MPEPGKVLSDHRELCLLAQQPNIFHIDLFTYSLPMVQGFGRNHEFCLWQGRGYRFSLFIATEGLVALRRFFASCC